MPFEAAAAGPPDELIFVDPEEVDLASKVDVETSGVRWHISQHKKPAGIRGAVKTEAKQESVVKTEPVKGEEPDSEGDLSPPRPAQKAKAKAAEVPAAKAKAVDSDSDLSPPRAVKAEKPADADSDLSPPRGGGKAKDAPAKEKRARHDSDSDLSPTRAAKREAEDVDLSPPRQGKPAKQGKRHDSDSDISVPRRAAKEEKTAVKDEERMSSGLRAGLVRGSDLKDEAAQLRADRKAAILSAPAEETGRDATTVYRNKQGQKISREEWADQQQKKRKKRLSDYPEQELEWGGGVKQQANADAEKVELERIAAQPFARYTPDERYMEELKGRQAWNDPMRKFQEEEEDNVPTAAGSSSVATPAAPEPPKKKPKCPHAAWPNRFNIAPGYRWDGKVRGNGYENKWLETKNHRAFKKQEAWKYDMEEM